MRNAVSHEVSLAARAGERDVRPGDRFIFRIQALKCPLGGIWLQPVRYDADALRAEVWEEIKAANRNNQVIRGRILNRVSGGFAVGVAGHVGRLDMSKADPQKVKKLGVLQEFVITHLMETPSGKTFLDLAHEGHEGRSFAKWQDGPRRYTRHATSEVNPFEFDEERKPERKGPG